MTFEEWWIEQKGGQELTKYEAAKNAWYFSRLDCVKELQRFRSQQEKSNEDQS